MDSTIRQMRYEGVHTKLFIEQPADGVIVVKIEGTDTGEFGDAPMKALDEWLSSSRPVDFFIDARKVRGASIDVSSDWANWLRLRKGALKTVTMLTGNRLLQITADFVRRFAELQGIMWVCTEAEVFDLSLDQAIRRSLVHPSL